MRIDQVDLIEKQSGKEVNVGNADIFTNWRATMGGR